MDQRLEVSTPIMEVINCSSTGIAEELYNEFSPLANNPDSYYRFIAIGMLYDRHDCGEDFTYRDKIEEWLKDLQGKTLNRMRKRTRQHLKELKDVFARYPSGAKMSDMDLTVFKRMRAWLGHALNLLRICGLGSALLKQVRQFDEDVKSVIEDWSP